MMKIVPASRLVTEASLEPPSSTRRRAITLAGGAFADCVSITATRVHPRNAPRGGGDDRMYQPFVKIWLGGPAVVPAKAGTHNHRANLLEKGVCRRCLATTAAAYGSLLSQGRRPGQFKLTLNS